MGELGLHLQERIATARRLVETMNGQLTAHPTNSGITVRLRWRPGRELGQDTEQALRLLKRSPWSSSMQPSARPGLASASSTCFR